MPRARSGAGWSIDDRDPGGGAAAAVHSDGTGRAAGAGEAPHPFDAPEDERYELGGELGQGGMGRVVAARDLRLGRVVARKSIVVPADAAAVAERRFAREALITATLDHPSIVPILDAGRGRDGALYYTMRLVRGRTLGAAIHEARSLPARLGLLRQFVLACEAVAYAHDQRVVHRDLKPDNILVGPFGEAQVADWGLARRLDEPGEIEGGAGEPGCAPSSPVGPVTRAGGLVGTPAYMSPEQARGETAGPASDVWSLGAVLYELVAGRAPIAAGHDEDAVLAAVRRGDVAPLLTIQPDAPAELAAITGKALSVGPAGRYPDARALAADLERFLDGRLVEAHRYSTGEQLRRVLRAWRAPLAVAGAAAVLLLATAGLAWRRTTAERDRALAAQQQAQRALAEADRNLSASLTNQALSALADGGRPEAEQLAARALRLDDRPDARGVIAAFARAGRPRLIGRSPAPCERPRPRGDGAVLCVRDGEVSLHEGWPPRLRWRRALSARDAAWVAGGQRVASTDEHDEIRILDENDGRTIASLGRLPPSGAWHGATSALSLVVNRNGLTLVDGRRLTTKTVSPCGPGPMHAAGAASSDGERVAIACSDGRVVLLAPDGTPLRSIPVIAPDRRGPAALALSPDGALLVVTTLDGDAWTVNPGAGGDPVRFPLGLGEVREVLFAPDGERVLLLSVRGGPALWDPRASAMPVRFAADHDAWAAFSASGRELLIGGEGLRRFAVPEHLRPTRFRPEGGAGLAGVAASPAGDDIALAAGDGRLVVLEAERGRVRFVDRFQEGVVKGVQFSPDGDGLIAWAAGLPSLRSYDRAGRPRRTTGSSMLRRAARLPSGWIVGAIYSDGAILIPPEGRPLPEPLPRVGARPFFDLAHSGDGRTLLLLSEDGEVSRIDDADPPALRRVLPPHAGARAVALSADGRVFALGDARGVALFDVASAAPRGRCDAPDLRILDVALSADGRLVAAGDLDGGVRVWSTSDGRLRGILRGHDERVAAVTFMDRDRLLLTASWDGTARLFDLTVLDRPAAALADEVERAWSGPPPAP